MLIGECTWDEVEKIDKNKVIILPVGGTEAHGKHLPLNTDSFIPFEIGRIVATQTNSLLLPPIEYSYTYTLRKFPGTISLTSNTFYSFIHDIISELCRNGFRKILILNGHGGNAGIIKNVLKELEDKKEFRACLVNWWEGIKGVGHADGTEASVYMYFRSNLVKKVRKEKFKNYFGTTIPSPKEFFTLSGFRGDVSNISQKRGERIVNSVVRKLVKLIKNELIMEEKNGME